MKGQSSSAEMPKRAAVKSELASAIELVSPRVSSASLITAKFAPQLAVIPSMARRHGRRSASAAVSSALRGGRFGAFSSSNWRWSCDSTCAGAASRSQIASCLSSSTKNMRTARGGWIACSLGCTSTNATARVGRRTIEQLGVIKQGPPRASKRCCWENTSTSAVSFRTGSAYSTDPN